MTHVKLPSGDWLSLRLAYREAIITLTGPMTTRQVADEIASAVVRETYRNAYLEHLALRALRREGAAAAHFSQYITPHDEPYVRTHPSLAV